MTLRFSSRILFLFVIIFLVCFESSLSQPTEIHFGRFSIDQGLSNATVTAIVQDKFGFMWIGTEDGLNRYDGYSFIVYKHNTNDTSSIRSSWISSLSVDPTGDIWVGTKDGVDRYDQNHNRFVHYGFFLSDANSFEDYSVSSIVIDHDSNVWFANAYHGLIFFNHINGAVTYFKHNERDQNSIASDSVLGLMIDRENNVWINYLRRGFSVYQPELQHFTTYGRDQNDLDSNGRFEVTSICQDVRGEIWMSFFGGGIGRFDKKAGSILHFLHNPRQANSLSDPVTLHLLSDSHGNIWVGTFSRGLDRFDPGQNVFFHYSYDANNDQSLGGDRVYAIFEDRAGALWIGTFKGGLSVYDPVRLKFTHVHHKPNDANSLSENTVVSICEDTQGEIWIGTDQGGLDRYDQVHDTFTHFVHDSRDVGSLANNSVSAICEDRNGQLWIGMFSGGMDRFDPKRNTFVHYRHDPRNPRGIGSDNIKALCLDADGELWISFDEKFVNRYDAATNTFVPYQLFDSTLAQVAVRETQGMTQGNDGNIWVATFGNGLFRVNKNAGTVKHYNHDSHNPRSLSNSALYCVTTDDKGNLWVGSFGSGLSRFDQEADSFQHYTEADGLPSNFVKGILPDEHGNLWLSTMRGLSRFSPGTKTFRNFDLTDGVQATEFRTGSFHKGRSGKFYFGGINGLNIFYPDSVKDNPFLPQVVISGFKVFDKPAALEQSPSSINRIELSYKQDYFAFEFVALNYTVPEKNQYAYMLEGFDKKWIMCGTRRYASYTHLDGGIYVFHVKASNNDGVWNEKDASVTLVILPPYWNTWWFRCLVVFMIAGIPFTIYRYRFNKLLELERTRNRIARDLHDEVSATLSGINYFAEAITQGIERRQISSVKKYLSLIRESANAVQDSIADIIWSVNPEHDNWDQLFAKFRRFASDVLESKSIQYHIEMPNNLSLKPLTMEMRRNFWLIYKEMVTNTLKHSDCKHVDIQIILVDRNRLCLTISDDGKGFDPALPTERNGIANIRARTELLHGTVDLTTSPSQGTRWKLLFSAD
jgi:ligand-binding sensor domain-containing protein/two-component sensor histidine kinase